MTFATETVRGLALRGLILALLGLFAGTALAESASKGLKPGDDAPAFSGVTPEGATVASKELLAKTRAVLVAFWGVRCSACLDEIPALRKIQDEFGGGALQVVGVNVDGVDGPTLKALMAEEKIAMNYTVLTDPQFKIVDAFRMTAAPLTILIDRDGKVRYSHEDYKAGDEVPLRATIQSVTK